MLAVWGPRHVVVPVLGHWPYGDLAVRSMAHGPRPAAYVCAGMACGMPIRDFEALAKTIREFKANAGLIEPSAAARATTWAIHSPSAGGAKSAGPLAGAIWR